MPRKKYSEKSKKEIEIFTEEYKKRAELTKTKYKKHSERYGSKGKMFEPRVGLRAFPSKSEYDKIEIDAAIRSARIMGLKDNDIPANLYRDESQSIILAGNLMGQPPFNTMGSGEYNEIETIRMQTLAKQQQQLVESSVLKSRLMENPPAPNSKERKELVENILFDHFISNLAHAEIEYNNAGRKNDIYLRILSDIGIPTFNIWKDGIVPAYEESIQEQLDDTRDMKLAIGEIPTVYNKYHVSNIQMILSKPDGIEKLKKYYHDAIVNSDRYKDLVEAENKEEIAKELMDISDSTLYKEYQGVKLPTSLRT